MFSIALGLAFSSPLLFLLKRLPAPGRAGGGVFLTAKIAVTVYENGDGMSEETQKHIFEKFYQGDSSRKAEGNGLGLALVKRILDMCGGEIKVKSTPDEGAAFTVLLPLVR